MSSIPNAKMKHAHVQHDEDEHSDHVEKKPATDAQPKAEKKPGKTAKLTDAAKDVGERAQELAGEAVDAVKSRPKTAAAIGAALVAGAAAIIGGPAAARALKGDKKPGPKKASKKTAAKKG